MKSGRTTELSYNAQAVADQQTGMVVAADVVNDGNDSSQLVSMLDHVRDNLGSGAQENLADGSYASALQMHLAEQAEHSILTSPGPNEEAEGSDADKRSYHSSRFTYDEATNRCMCPHGNILLFQRTKQSRRKTHEVRIYHCRDFRQCPHRW